MEALLDQIEVWFEGGRSVALASVIKTWGSSPRPVGAMMAISDQNEISGSVSGGCVEGAVIDAAQTVLKTGLPKRLFFGVANEEAWEVGLSCGGEIEIFLRIFTPGHLTCWRQALERGESFWVPLILEADHSLIGLEYMIFEDGSKLMIPSKADSESEILKVVKAAMPEGKSAVVATKSDQIQEIFFQRVDPPRQLILVGGVHIAIPLASLADTLGFEVTVIDPRRLFGTTDRFPTVKKLLQEWPQEAFQKVLLNDTTGVVMLTHDPKIDDPALKIVLDSPVFYLGALGSRKTHQKRLGRLKEQGVKEKDLKRIHGPVGLNLGASTPEEIALAIMAEIIQVWHHRK